MDEVRTDTGPTVQDWIDAAYTKKLAKNASVKKAECLLQLLRVCQGTGDPAVARAFNEYHKWAALEHVFTNGESS